MSVRSWAIAVTSLVAIAVAASCGSTETRTVTVTVTESEQIELPPSAPAPDPPAGESPPDAETGEGVGSDDDLQAPRPKRTRAAVRRVVDGDTLELEGGKRVRLLQVDAPEPGQDECYGREAGAVLAELLPRGSVVRLEAEPSLGTVDDYGRLLRYVFADGANVNVVLVRRGAASVYFFRGQRGRYAERLLAEAQRARRAGKGLWGACPGAKLRPERAVDTGPAVAASPPG
jgi:micrococcal nuclease